MTLNPAQFAGHRTYEEALQAYANALNAPLPFSDWVVFANAIGKEYEDSPPMWPRAGSRGYYTDLRNQTYEAAFGSEWKSGVVSGSGRTGTVPVPPATARESGSRPGGARALAAMRSQQLRLLPWERVAQAVMHRQQLTPPRRV